jgi:RNA-directed DNA polymerase
VRARVKDKRVLALVKAFLKAGVFSELGEHRETLTGTPQGGLCSAEHNPPYAQRQVMRSAGLEALVAGGLAGERCA